MLTSWKGVSNMQLRYLGVSTSLLRDAVQDISRSMERNTNTGIMALHSTRSHLGRASPRHGAYKSELQVTLHQVCMQCMHVYTVRDKAIKHTCSGRAR